MNLVNGGIVRKRVTVHIPLVSLSRTQRVHDSLSLLVHSTNITVKFFANVNIFETRKKYLNLQ